MLKKTIRNALILGTVSYTGIGLAGQESHQVQNMNPHAQVQTGSHLEDFQDLVSMQEWAVQEYADRPLFGVKKNGEYHWTTYQDFGKNVERLRGGLKSLGLDRGDKVAIISDNSPEWAVSCYATLGLGAAFVPMYTNQTFEEWKYKVENSDAKILFVADDTIYEKVKNLPESIPSLEHVINIGGSSKSTGSYKSLLKVGKKQPEGSVRPEADDLMGLIYTSGTTGTPKGVMLSHNNVSSLLKEIPKVIELGGEKSLSFLPWAHIFGQLAELHALLYLGNSTGFAESTKTIVSNMKEVHPTIFFSVPTVFNRIYDKTHSDALGKGGLTKFLFKNWKKVKNRQRQGDKPGRVKTWLADLTTPKIVGKIKESFGGELKYAMSGGAKLDRSVGEFIDDLGITVLEGYGMSETSGIISMNTLKENRIGSVGKPLPGISIRFDHSRAASNDPGEGEIIACGPNIMQGYYKLPEKTQGELTEDGCLRTGDIGKFDSDGFLYITGRAKEIYKLENGKYVVPTTYENRIKLSRFFKDAFLYGDNRPYNVLLVTVDTDQVNAIKEKDKLDDAQIQKMMDLEIEAINKEFPGYVSPRKHAVVKEDWNQDNGLLTPTMKIKRNKVFSVYQDKIEALYN